MFVTYPEVLESNALGYLWRRKSRMNGGKWRFVPTGGRGSDRLFHREAGVEGIHHNPCGVDG
jgi:hypothetical protein